MSSLITDVIANADLSFQDVEWQKIENDLSSVDSVDSFKEMLSGAVDQYAEAPNTERCTTLMRLVSLLLTRAKRCDSASPLVDSEDLLLIAMFLSDLSSIADDNLFKYFCASVRLLFELSFAWFSSNESGSQKKALSEQEKENSESLLEMLGSLIDMTSRRLVTSVDALRLPSLQIEATKTLHAIFLLNWKCLFDSSVSEEVSLRVKDQLQKVTLGFIEPIEVALEYQFSKEASKEVNNAREDVFGLGGDGGFPVSVLCSLLFHIERVLWVIHYNGSIETEKNKTKTDNVCETVFHTVSSKLLSIFKRYIVLQQHRRLEGGHQQGEDASGKDIFRVYAVQRNIQRVLSVALEVLSVFKVTTVVNAETERSGLVAAANSFGGVISVLNPNALQQRVKETIKNEEVKEEIWSEDGRALRTCSAMFTVKEPNVAKLSDIADIDELDDNDLLLLEGSGETGNLLKTSFGLVSKQTLVDMIISSVRRLEPGIRSDAIKELHVRGLQEMQYLAAKKAQREEYERAKLIERQGIEVIPPSDLITHVKDTNTVHQQGMKLLRNPTSRAQFQKCAFLSVLNSYQFLEGEAEARIRVTQALIARCLLQVPLTLRDSCIDEIFLKFEDELTAELAKGAKSSESWQKFIRTKPNSCYQLLLQILFSLFASLAPFDERNSNVFELLRSESFEDLGSNSSDRATVRTFVEGSVDIENPIKFLQEKDARVPSYESTRKRGRDEDEEGEDNIPSHNSNQRNAPFNREERDAENDDFAFHNDSKGSPSVYSHFLCRFLEVVYQEESVSFKLVSMLLIDILSQAPGLTRYIWNYIYKHFCLSVDRKRCIVGNTILSYLAVNREVYRMCAVNLLVHLSMSNNEYARRLAIEKIDKLLSAQDASGHRIIDASSERALLRYAKQNLALIPEVEASAAVPTKAAPAGGNEGILGEEDSSEREAERKCNRHLGLFLILCNRNPRELFAALMHTFVQCIEQNNVTMVKLLPNNVDIKRMSQLLLRSDPINFVSTVMPIVVRYSSEAIPLVQSILWFIRDALTEMAGEPNYASTLPKVAKIIVDHATTMYKNAEIKVGEKAVIHDIRFLAPFLAFLSRDNLRDNILVSFLYFVQVQLQFKGDKNSLSIKDQSYVLSRDELEIFIKKVIQEVLVSSKIPFNDKMPRNMFVVDLMVYIHRKPHSIAEHHRHLSMGNASSGGGILDSANSNLDHLPAIRAQTVREIVRVCLRMNREMEGKPSEALYGPRQMHDAIMIMINDRADAIPSQLMATILVAADVFSKLQYSEFNFVHFVVQNVLPTLERAAIWETDPEMLWKGVLVFCENYYVECSGFLVGLPDTVLTKALRDRPQLCAAFKNEHGNNASFARILGNI